MTPPSPPGREQNGRVSTGRVATGRVEIRDLRAFGIHGVLAHERTRAQPFSVDLDVWFDLSAATVSDALADTVDYGALVKTVAGVVSESSYSLLEALAAAICQRVLADEPRAERVEVAVRKMRPPVAVDVGSVGVRLVDVRRP
ncbi:MAG: dihydroneopterin aldolase [Acidimicrobiales bacterium]